MFYLFVFLILDILAAYESPLNRPLPLRHFFLFTKSGPQDLSGKVFKLINKIEVIQFFVC